MQLLGVVYIPVNSTHLWDRYSEENGKASNIQVTFHLGKEGWMKPERVSQDTFTDRCENGKVTCVQHPYHCQHDSSMWLESLGPLFLFPSSFFQMFIFPILKGYLGLCVSMCLCKLLLWGRLRQASVQGPWQQPRAGGATECCSTRLKRQVLHVPWCPQASRKEWLKLWREWRGI